MKTIYASLCLALIATFSAPAAAQSADVQPVLMPDDDVAGDTPENRLTKAEQSMPAQLNARQRYQYRRAFLEIEAGRTTSARNILSAMGRGPLHDLIEGQILLRQGANAGANALISWLKANPRSPQAPTIAALARKAGAQDIPPLVQPRRLSPINLTPPVGPRTVVTGTSAETSFATRAQALVKAEKPLEVEALLDREEADLSPSVRSEWAQKAGWMAYIGLDDATALRLGARAAKGGGEWAAMGDWVAGLAAFRMDNWTLAARHFDSIAKQPMASGGLRAGAAYWAARSHVRAGSPHLATPRLKSAIAFDRSGFYGLLAAEVLGTPQNFDWREPDFIQADWTTLRNEPGAQRAAALVEIGQLDLADRELRHMAATASVTLYEPLLRLAARLNLPATQYWLASNPPPGQMPPMSAQFPSPAWEPFNGWRVDRNLVFAHALQESKFITTARSGPGAKGTMQLMPGTARDLARAAQMTHREDLLSDPTFNVEYGQSYMEMLRDDRITQGRLPQIIAGYNAGLAPVQRWNDGGVRYHGDPLLYMASIPYWETRHYVEVVLRNYWLYEMKSAAQEDGKIGPSRTRLAENRWPGFPGRPDGN